VATRPRIVLVHGRAAQFDIPESTSRLWADALRLSLMRVGSKFAGDVDVDYVYFGGFWRPDAAHESPRLRDSKGRRYSVALEPSPHVVVEAAPPGGGPALVGDLAGLADKLPDFILKPLLQAAIPDVFEYLEKPDLQKKVDKAIREFDLPWHVTRLGCRAEYLFTHKGPRNGTEAHDAMDFELERFLHLYCLNRGILLTPFHNMALMAPQTSTEDVDLHTKVFREAVRELVG